jgi:HAE1 family hydrophobic/amphiphilic exporter-1/multidrug efflux pump
MTSMAFVLGCLPLAISSGAGSASRHSIGTGVVGGMLASTFVATYFVPLFFVAVMRLAEKLRGLNGAALPRGTSRERDNDAQSH